MAKNLLKFYKNSQQPTNVAAGSIWFNTTNRTIEVYNGTEWEKYAGKLETAEWDQEKQILTIKKYDGSSIALNFSHIASTDDITAINEKLGEGFSAGNTVKAAVDAINEKLGEGFDKDNTVVKAISDVLGTSGDAASANTVYGAKKYADEAVAAEKDRADKAYDAFGAANTVKTDLLGDVESLDTLGKLEDAIKGITEGDNSVAKQIENALDALDYEGATDLEGGVNYVSQVTQTDGKIEVTKAILPKYSVVAEKNSFITVTPTTENISNTFTISTNDIASAEALGKLTERVTALDQNDENGKGKVPVLEGKVSALEGAVESLASATHFLGVTSTEIADGESVSEVVIGEETVIPSKGDIVITADKKKEFVYDGSVWIELGDTTAEAARIGALETTVNADKTGLVDKVAALEAAVGGDSVVNSIDGAKGALTLAKGSSAAGVVNFAMDGTKLTAEVNVGVKTVETGAENGTISVNGSDVAVKGLGSAAYAEFSAFDVAGAAATAESNAKGYADSLATNYATSAQGLKADSAVQNGQGDDYVAAEKGNDNILNVSAKILNMTDVAEGKKGLADASDVKQYVDNSISDGLAWVEFE